MTVPYYVSEDESDMRGIKPGWYAMDGGGQALIRTVFQPQGMPQ